MTRAVFTDLDNTLTNGYSTHAFMEFLGGRGVIGKEHVQRIHDATMGMKRGEISYLDSLENFFRAIQGFAGTEVSVLDAEAEAFLEGFAENIRPYAFELVGLAHEKGYRVVLVTGAVEFTARAFARRLNVDGVLGCEARVENGVVKAMKRDLLSPEGKARAVLACAERERILLEESVGLGDTEHDTDFMALCGKALAVNPTRRLREAAEKRGWPVVGPESVLRGLKEIL